MAPTFAGGLLLEQQGNSFLELEDSKTVLQSEVAPFFAQATDFLDYIFLFPDQGAWLRDPIIQQFAPPVNGSQPGVQLLIYNPVETLTSTATASSALALLPQKANSTVPLPGFWAMITLKGIPPFQLTTHPNLQILNNRTLMFARQASVLIANIDVSHINIVINIFGVYVADGLQILQIPDGTLTDDTNTVLLMNDSQTSFLLAG